MCAEGDRAKAELRADCLRRRRHMDEAEVEDFSRQITQRLISLAAFEEAHSVHTYVDGLPNEVKTRDFIRLSLDGGRRVAVPWVAAHGKAPFRSAEIRSLAELVPGPWGLLQPKETEAVWVDDDANGFDLVVVPGVAFDLRGYRIGHGGGFYDRFLRRARGLKVGLTYREFLLAEVPVAPHDIAVDAVVSEFAVHTIERRRE